MMIAKMTQQFVEQVAQLEAQCFHDPWSLRSITSELSNPLALWLVALNGEQVVGYIGSQSVMGEADMMNVAVAPDYRRKGIAATLIGELISQLRDAEVHSLALEVRASNTGAIELYRKLGFLQVGCRKNYYHNPKEDALILRKEWSL